MTEPNVETPEQETPEEMPEPAIQERVEIGMHPLGGLRIAVTGPDGQRGEAHIGSSQAFELSGQLQGLATMRMTLDFMEQQALRGLAQQQRGSGLILP